MAMPLTAEQAERVIDLGNQVRARYPRAFSHCHVEGDPERYDFIILFARAALADPLLLTTHRAGMNGKRGDPSDPSMDVMDFWHLASSDPRDVTAADVVQGAGAPGAFIKYQDITDPAGAGAIYIDPFTRSPYYPYASPAPTGLLAYSLFWGLGGEKHDPWRFDEQLGQYRHHGADAVRIIAHLPRTNADGTPGTFHHIGVEWSDPDFIDLLKRADDRLAGWGLKWYLTFTAGIRGIETEPQQLALVDRVNQAFEGRPNRRLLDEMANEYATNGLTTTIIRQMCRRNAQYPQRARWVSLSSPNAIHDGSGASIPDEVRRMYDGLPEATAITPHWNRSTNVPPDLGPYAPGIVWSGEPRGPKSSGTQTNDPAVLVGDMRQALAVGYTGYVGHSDSGFISTFLYPGPVPGLHGEWRVYSNHDRGTECLAALRDYRLLGTVPGDGGGEGGGGGGGEDPMIPYDENKSVAFGLACNDVYTEAFPDPAARCNAFDPGMVSVHSSRAAWDHYVGGMLWEDSKRKHVNEFRAEYGLPPV